jgi:Protein of unknown function (DUF3016)
MAAMQVRIATLITVLAAVPSPHMARADVRVAFIEPQRYTDAGSRGDRRIGPSDPILIDLGRYLSKLGEQYLQAGDTVTVDVLDIDLAGRFEPWRWPGNEVRVMTETTWPRIALRYSLARDGQVVATGEETVADAAYLTRAGGRLGDDPLYYEKAMLDEWFRARFGRGRR